MSVQAKIETKNEITYKTLLKEKQYVKNLIAKLISRFGDSLDTIAYSWMVYELTGSKTMMATLFAVNGIPNLLFGMFAGVFAGYHSKKKIIFTCDMARGLTVLLTAILLLTNTIKPWYLYVLTFFNSTFETFRAPSASSMYSMVLDKEKLDYGMSLDSTLVRIAELSGFSLAAIFISTIGTGGTIVIDSMTFFISGFIIITIKYQDLIKKEAMTMGGSFKDLKDGFKYLLESKIVLNMCLIACFINFIFVPFNSMQAPYVKEILNRGVEALSFISVPLLLGMIIMGVLYPKLKKVISGFYTIILGGGFLGISYLLLSQLGRLSDSIYLLPLLATCSFLMGIGIVFMSTTIQIGLMTLIDKEFFPRVVSIFNVIGLCATPLGGFLVGVLCKIYNLSQLFLGISIIISALTLLQLFNKELKKL